jgi:hypothetical protein
VHLPELALDAGSFSRGRSRKRMLMSGKRILAKRYAQAIAKLLVHLLQYRMKHAARGTLEITKLF